MRPPDLLLTDELACLVVGTVVCCPGLRPRLPSLRARCHRLLAASIASIKLILYFTGIHGCWPVWTITTKTASDAARCLLCLLWVGCYLSTSSG